MPRDEQQKNLLSVPALESSIEAGLDSSFFCIGDWPEGNWWEIFGSKELNNYIQEALRSNPDLASIKKRIKVAAETSKVIRSKLFPLIYFNYEETWELLSHHGLYRALNPKIPINANLIDLTLSFDYEFDFWGKNMHLFRAALSQEKMQEAESAEVELITTTAVAQAYFALKTNIKRRELYEKIYAIRSEVLRLQELLFKNALFSELSPLFSEEEFLESQKKVYGIQEEVAASYHLLNVLMGKGPDASIEIGESLFDLPLQLTIPSALSLDLLARRPDLMAQIWRVEAFANEVGAAKADFYPSINLGAFIGLESTIYRLLFHGHSKQMGLQPALHLPIFTAGAIRANLRAKRAGFDEAVFAYNSLILRAIQEVADLLVLAKSIYSQKQDQRKIVESAHARLALVQLREQSGLDSAFASYAIEIELLEKQLEDVTLLYDQYLAAIKLIKALGGGYQSEYNLPLRAKETENGVR